MQRWQSSKILRSLCLVIAASSLFAIYAFGIWENPPGFYLDESVLSYNAYLLSQTGTGESGQTFPLYFPVYTGVFTQYSNPTQIYLLAILFKIFGPGILTARLFAAACMFAACLLLGFLARRISGKVSVGVVVGTAALSTPWLFEVGRLVLETFFYPLATMFLLWSIFRVSTKDKWTFVDATLISLSLTLLTFSYTIGRLLGPLLAGGLIVFCVNRQRIFSILKVWVMFALTLLPLALYIYQTPQLTKRFYLLSYMGPDRTYPDIFFQFVMRFLEDVNPFTMLFLGDTNPRHHIDGALGSFYISIFLLAVTGIIIIFLRHRRNSWWWYVIFGLLASVVPGALTVDSFHTLRMIAYPVFIITLTIPALEWMLDEPVKGENEQGRSAKFIAGDALRHGFALALLAVFVFESLTFHLKYYRLGPERGYVFDADYKPLYDEAVGRPERPIYLEDGYWGPAYIHAYWYATLEGKGVDDFVHLPYRETPPVGSLVLSSNEMCTQCDLVRKEGVFVLYIKKALPAPEEEAVPGEPRP